MYKETKINNGRWNAAVYVPDNIGTKKLPVFIFFPGTGEGGTNIAGLKKYGPAAYTSKGVTPDFITISVQPTNSWINNPAEIDTVLNEVIAQYPVDEKRICLTGLSAGGYSVTNYIFSSETRAKRVASVALVSAAPPDVDIFKGITGVQNAKVSYWSMCGTEDPQYGGKQGQFEMAKLVNGKVPNFKFIEIKGGKHDAASSKWITIYDPNSVDGKAMYDWNLSAMSAAVPEEPDTNPKEVVLTGKDIYGDISKYGAVPGDFIILKGEYINIALWNMKGTKDKPYTFVIDGEVTVKGNPSYLFNIKDSSYFSFLKSNSNSKLLLDGQNGFTTGSGLAINKSNNFSVEEIEVTGTDVGIMIKSDPNYTNYEGDGFSFENIRVAKNYIHDINGEGTYIGYNGPGLVDLKDSTGKVITQGYAYRMRNVLITQNKVERTGWDGIQATCGDGLIISENDISAYGLAKKGTQDTGILTNGNNIQVINNKIKDGWNAAIAAGITGNGIIVGNTISNIGNREVDAIYIKSTPVMQYLPFLPTIRDNDIINVGRNGIVVEAQNTVPGIISDNRFSKIGGKIIQDGSNSVKENNVILDEPTDPQEPETPECPYPVAVLMSDGTQLPVAKK